MKVYCIYLIMYLLSCTVTSFKVRLSPLLKLSRRNLSSFRAINNAIPSVTVLDSKAKLFKDGNPLIYDGAITSSFGGPKPGEEVLVKDGKGDVFGRGFFNPYSQYRVRLITTKEDKLFDSPISDLIQDRIRQAVSLRSALQLPRGDTDVYRLINGEGDRLSGLMVDVLGCTVVIQSSAIWVELNRNTIESALNTIPALKDKALLWRRAESRLKQDGWEHLTVTNSSAQPETEKTVTPSSPSSKGFVTENNIYYTLCAETDQKTGFYCDQRDNRQYLRALSGNKTVADVYCYSGGFTLNALYGGARSVTAIDSSLKALETLRENAVLNGFHGQLSVNQMGPNATATATLANTATVVETSTLFKPLSNCKQQSLELIKGDAEKCMQDLINLNRSFDIVVCDPPKLAPRRTSLEQAMRKYMKINKSAMKLVNPQGGLLFTCTCSAAMTQSGKFESVLQDAAKFAGREITILRVSGAGGDHTIAAAYPEGRYLTAVLLYVH